MRAPGLGRHRVRSHLGIEMAGRGQDQGGRGESGRMTSPVTPRQREVLAAIDRLTTLRGPTVRELGDALDMLSSCTVQLHIERLEARGLVRRGKPGESRGLGLTEKGREVLGGES